MTLHVAPGPEGLNEAAAIVARGLRRPALATVWIACLAIAFDLPVLSVAFWFAQYASSALLEFAPLAAAFWSVVLAALAAGLMAVTGVYALGALRRALPTMARTALALLPPVALGGAFLAATAPDFFAAAFWALAIVVVPTRLVASRVAVWLVEAGLTERRAVIAGGSEHAENLIRGLARRPGNDVKLYGIFDDRDDIRSPIQILGVPKIGTYDDLITFARNSEIDLVIIALPLEAEARVTWLLEAFKVLPVEVRLSAYSQDFAFSASSGEPLIAALSSSFAPERRLRKRAFDLVFASLALVIFAPVMIVAAIAIRLDSPGPIFFRQRRHGYNDRVVEVLKFRSMYDDAADPEARCVVSRGDPRVTRVGRFLRRSSIDELPQLFNVLSGSLSLVGPRPHAINAVSSQQERFTRIVDGYSARHRLPPGITGWAQINGWRGEIDATSKLRARFEHDLYYIENWSIWLDLKILVRTPVSLLTTTAAY